MDRTERLRTGALTATTGASAALTAAQHAVDATVARAIHWAPPGPTSVLLWDHPPSCAPPLSAPPMGPQHPNRLG
ncbi:MAG: hypothetical protein IPN02_12900 [Candidatus Microthrix sp.]|uniref:Uncharacterized protein n=1 Tax=Candidatus Neomicrothrix subdominans TaxID=2954438 RepID=A0A936TDL2_9ACTN|nr:hypothetical protein [Candidatus Microthrix subdominans]